MKGRVGGHPDKGRKLFAADPGFCQSQPGSSFSAAGAAFKSIVSGSRQDDTELSLFFILHRVLFRGVLGDPDETDGKVAFNLSRRSWTEGR